MGHRRRMSIFFFLITFSWSFSFPLILDDSLFLAGRGKGREAIYKLRYISYRQVYMGNRMGTPNFMTDQGSGSFFFFFFFSVVGGFSCVSKCSTSFYSLSFVSKPAIIYLFLLIIHIFIFLSVWLPLMMMIFLEMTGKRVDRMHVCTLAS